LLARRKNAASVAADTVTNAAVLVVVTVVADPAVERVAADPAVAAANADIRPSNLPQDCPAGGFLSLFYPIKITRAGAPSDPTSFNGRQNKS
jgi:hypothetical protein